MSLPRSQYDLTTPQGLEQFQQFLVRLVADDYVTNVALDNQGEIRFDRDSVSFQLYMLPSGQYLVEVGDSGLRRVCDEVRLGGEELPVLVRADYDVAISNSHDVDWVITPTVNPRPPAKQLVESRFYYVDAKYLLQPRAAIAFAPSTAVIALEPYSWELTHRFAPQDVFLVDPKGQDAILALRRFLHSFHSPKTFWFGDNSDEFRRDVTNITSVLHQSLTALLAESLKVDPHAQIKAIMNPTPENPTPAEPTAPQSSNGSKLFNENELKPREEVTVTTDETIVHAPVAAETDQVQVREGLPRDQVEGAAHPSVRDPDQPEALFLATAPESETPSAAAGVPTTSTVERQELALLDQLARKYFGVNIVDIVREAHQESEIRHLRDRLDHLERLMIRQMGQDPDQVSFNIPRR